MTEAKHIKAVKEPWRRSNKFNALGQMLLTNQRSDKLSRARQFFAANGMLKDDVIRNVTNSELPLQTQKLYAHLDNGYILGEVQLAQTRGKCQSKSMEQFAY